MKEKEIIGVYVNTWLYLYKGWNFPLAYKREDVALFLFLELDDFLIATYPSFN